MFSKVIKSHKIVFLILSITLILSVFNFTRQKSFLDKLNNDFPNNVCDLCESELTNFSKEEFKEILEMGMKKSNSKNEKLFFDSLLEGLHEKESPIPKENVEVKKGDFKTPNSSTSIHIEITRNECSYKDIPDFNHDKDNIIRVKNQLYFNIILNIIIIVFLCIVLIIMLLTQFIKFRKNEGI